MAEIVATLALSHAPGLTGWLDQATPSEQKGLVDGYTEMGRLLRATKPDVIVGVANDHCLNMPVDEAVDFCIGTAEQWSGPADWFKDWLNVPDYEIGGNRKVAETIFERAGKADIEMTRSDTLLFDDNWSVPLYYLTPDYDIPLVPIHMNCIVPPLLEPDKCYAAGQALARIIAEDLPGDMRVALMATGGLSHDPGGPKYFEVDEKFDRWFLGLLEEGNPARVLEEVTIDKMVAAGDGGTSELLAWIVAMGAVGGRRARTVCYEPAASLRSGMGAVYWDMAGAGA